VGDEDAGVGKWLLLGGVDELVDGRVLHAAHAKIALHAAHNDDDRTDEVTMHRLLLNTGVVLFCGARKVILKLWQRHSTLKHL
jgi:hypothetical protein